MIDLIEGAKFVATLAHKGQMRKYDKLPYITHPRNVAQLVEDTDVTYSDLVNLFGNKVGDMVYALTDQYTPEKYPTYNRTYRKRKEADRIAVYSAEVQTIKLADMYENTRSIIDHDPAFAKTYLQEKAYLFDRLCKGNPVLRAMVKGNI